MNNENDKEMMKNINKEESQPTKTTRKAQIYIDPKTSASFWLRQTITTKIRRVQELVIAKIYKKIDSIKVMTRQKKV